MAVWFTLVSLSIAVAGLRFRVRRRRRRSAPAIPRELLAALRAVLDERHPDAVWRGVVPGSLSAVLEVDGQETAVSLRRLVIQAEAFPDSVPDLVGRLLREVRAESLEAPEHHDFALVAHAIRPQVRTVGWLEQHGGAFGDSALVSRALGADLATCYVIDSGDAMTFVCRRHLQIWGRSVADVDRLAVTNLRAASRSPVLEVGDGTEPVVSRDGDGYDAARLLLVDPDLVEGLLVAVPDRDLLWLGRAEGGQLASLMAGAAAEAERSPRPVSGQLYVVHAGRLEAVEAVEAGGTVETKRGPQFDGAPVTTTSSSDGSSKTARASGSNPTKVSS